MAEQGQTLWQQLQAPFPEQEIFWRPGRYDDDAGEWLVPLAYVAARAVQQRLDDLVGPDKWEVEYLPTFNDPSHQSLRCELRIDCDGLWRRKQDGGINSSYEAVKGGFSDAFKRAAVLWGIGRYLYYLPKQYATLVPTRKKGCQLSRLKMVDGTTREFFWFPPALPSWALPGGSGRPDGNVVTTATSVAEVDHTELQKRVEERLAWIQLVTPESPRLERIHSAIQMFKSFNEWPTELLFDLVKRLKTMIRDAPDMSDADKAAVNLVLDESLGPKLPPALAQSIIVQQVKGEPFS